MKISEVLRLNLSNPAIFYWSKTEGKKPKRLLKALLKNVLVGVPKTA
ncbi:MAG: hypothetical protein MUD08_12660 [Cytophagales bacterium]|nr:hypothetical protein [Cytophagales bacterium]